MSRLTASFGIFSSLCLFVLLIMPALSTGEILTIDEDFSTTARRDSLMTSALWDTTALKVHLHSQILFSRGSLNTNSAYASARSSDHLFLADGTVGLRSINLTDPDSPLASDLMACTDQAKSVAISGDFAFVAAGAAGLQVVDISTPSAMIDGGYFTNDGDLQYVSAVAISGSTLYLAESGAGVAVFNISNPAQPFFVRRLATGTWARDVFSWENLLLVVDDGLKIFDLSNPYDPTELSFTSVSGTALRATANGGRAFVACGSSGLQIFDIDNPSDPLPLGTIDEWSSCQHATATTSGDTVLVAAATEGLFVLDASDPAEIEILGSRDTIHNALHVLYFDNLIHMCTSSEGLKIYQIDPDGLDPLKNLAQSINLNDGDDPISRVSISAALSDSISFQVTVDGGSNWHEIEPGSGWFDFPDAGTDVRWRASLFETDASPIGGPALVTFSLSMDRLSSYAEITSVGDVPGDSGLQLRLGWSASRHDIEGSDHLVTEYSIYRRFDGEREDRLEEPAAKASQPDTRYPPGQWDFISTVPADRENQYATVVPTLADSSHAGLNWSVYFVRTRTTEPGVFFDSPPDSGYSVNNLQPSPPTGLVIDFSPPAGTQLSWDPSDEPRFAHFRIYRSQQAGTPIQPANLWAITTETDYFDETTTDYFYQLTQMTLDGQESDPAFVLSAVSEKPPIFQLLANIPNPFNPLTKLSFLVGESLEPVSVDVFDSRGRKIRRLLAQPLSQGWHTVTWNGRDNTGRACASGLYHARLRQGPHQRMIKMTLVR